jgi:hypothetical protein
MAKRKKKPGRAKRAPRAHEVVSAEGLAVGRFTAERQPSRTPTRRQGEREGDGASSSSSSSKDQEIPAANEMLTRAQAVVAACQPPPRPKGKIGAPSGPKGMTVDVITKLLEGLEAGTPLTILTRPTDMPSYNTVESWRREYPAFTEEYARARDAGYDQIALDAQNIADDGSRDYTEIETRTGVKVLVDYDHIQRSKLRVWTRLELLKRWDPARYGEAVKLMGDKDNPLQHKHSGAVVNKFKMSTADLEAIAARGRVGKGGK